MTINTLLAQRNMTMYRLAKTSGLPSATVSDICSGKAKIEKCAADTLYKIAKALGVSMEDLIRDRMEEAPSHRSSFDVFKSNVCHQVKDQGDLDFIIQTLESGLIRQYAEQKWYAESLYLLAMVDYLSRENGLPLCSEYDDLRQMKLKNTLYPFSIRIADAVSGGRQRAEASLRQAIPEFKRFNIIESEVRNVL